MINEGLILMVVGMSVVFLFLTLLIFLMKLMSFIIIKLNEIYPEKQTETRNTKNTLENEVALAVAVVRATTTKL